MKRSKLILIFIAIPVCIFFVFYKYLQNMKELQIFPNKNIIVNHYSDKAVNGSTEIKNFIAKDNYLELTYTLKKDFPYPFAGVSFRSKNPFNVNEYDIVVLEVSSRKSKLLRFMMRSLIKNYTVKKEPDTYLHKKAEINTWKKQKLYKIPKEKIKIPLWWFTHNKLTNIKESLQNNFDNINHFNIQSGSNFPTGVEDTIIIKKFTFIKDPVLRIKFFVSFIILYYIIAISIIVLIHNHKILRNKTKTIILPFKYLKSKKDLDDKTTSLIKYLGKNYHEASLTVEKTGYKCNLSSLEIPQILKDQFKLSFPQYLNAIRLAEAKRLLEKTSLKIIDIAFKVGYSNKEHFHRVFKKIEGISPVQYRKSYKQTDIKNENIK